MISSLILLTVTVSCTEWLAGYLAFFLHPQWLILLLILLTVLVLNKVDDLYNLVKNKNKKTTTNQKQPQQPNSGKTSRQTVINKFVKHPPPIPPATYTHITDFDTILEVDVAVKDWLGTPETNKTSLSLTCAYLALRPAQRPPNEFKPFENSYL